MVLEMDRGSSCDSRNRSWKFVWFDKLMVEVRVVLEMDSRSSCGSRNGWWKFVWF